MEIKSNKKLNAKIIKCCGVKEVKMSRRGWNGEKYGKFFVCRKKFLTWYSKGSPRLVMITGKILNI